jgi:hypothetical protein
MALDDYLNQISRNIGQAPRDRTISDSFYGLNIVGRNAPIAVNTENHGFTFFTRPSLNLSYDNLAVDRVLSNLLMENPYSVQRMIRCYLDPRLPLQGITSPGVDNLNPFIPLLSNNLISLSGWPDFTLNTQTTQPGLYREAYSYVDDVPYNYESFDIQASFRNISGDPISFMFLLWGWYMGLVYEGRLMPYPDHVLYNRVDYNTRIYRLIMDKTRTYVTRIGACGASFPMTAPIGNIFNFEGDGSETPFTTANDQISVNFRCMGFTYYDHILIYEFNTVGELFNASMRDGERQRNMVKLHPAEREYFNYHAYPRINEATMELEWWVFKNYYESQKGNVLRAYGNV